MSRPYDIIVFGATGFTGALCAEYLLLKGPANLKFALAGRSQAKLQTVRSKLALLKSSAENIPLLIADSSDASSLDAVVSQTRVIITTVGPFAQHGVPLVESCVRNGTDYIDSTGEPDFIRKCIDRFHDEAVRKGVSIVPSCGFDSMPSDIGTLLVADHFAKQGKKVKEVRYSCVDAAGGISGGTIHSALGLMEKPFKELRALSDPYYLNPTEPSPASQGQLVKSERAVIKGPSIPGSSPMLRYEPVTKKWQTYFVMEATNTRYVRRTWGLFKKAYGENFKYSETMAASNVIFAFLTSLTISLGIVMLFFPPFRWAVKKIVPQGSGPSEKAMKNGYFTTKLVGVAEDGSVALATFASREDPGYRGTAKMLCEAALCLAFDRAVLDKGDKAVVGQFKPLKGGILTCASAMGLVLAERLRKVGTTATVVDVATA
ncbi:hypothetical protein HK101_001116 [Irineochytrium annulatum]|nr:hypothetical protein HK101_001116 [Irineochytrium annulatum]